MELPDTLTDTWTRHGDTIILALLGVTALAVILILLRTLRRARQAGRPEKWVSNVANVMVLGLSAEGMFVVAREKLHLPVVLAIVVFAVFEAVMLSSAMQATAQYHRTTVRNDRGAIIMAGHPGKHGTAVWVTAALAGIVVSLNSKSFVEFVLRLVLPLMAALMWWNALTAEGTSRPQGSWRWTPRRLLVAIGAVEPTERDLETVHRDRRIASMTRTAHRVHLGARPKAWHRARLVRYSLDADDAMMAAVRVRVARAHDAVALTAPPARDGAQAAPSIPAQDAQDGARTTAQEDAQPAAQPAQTTGEPARAPARTAAQDEARTPGERARAQPARASAPTGDTKETAWAVYCELRAQGHDPNGTELAQEVDVHPGSARRYLKEFKPRYAAGQRHTPGPNAAELHAVS